MAEEDGVVEMAAMAAEADGEEAAAVPEADGAAAATVPEADGAAAAAVPEAGGAAAAPIYPPSRIRGKECRTVPHRTPTVNTFPLLPDTEAEAEVAGVDADVGVGVAEGGLIEWEYRMCDSNI